MLNTKNAVILPLEVFFKEIKPSIPVTRNGIPKKFLHQLLKLAWNHRDGRICRKARRSKHCKIGFREQYAKLTMLSQSYSCTCLLAAFGHFLSQSQLQHLYSYPLKLNPYLSIFVGVARKFLVEIINLL